MDPHEPLRAAPRPEQSLGLFGTCACAVGSVALLRFAYTEATSDSVLHPEVPILCV